MSFTHTVTAIFLGFFSLFNVLLKKFVRRLCTEFFFSFINLVLFGTDKRKKLNSTEHQEHEQQQQQRKK